MNAQTNHVLNKTLSELPPEDRERVLAYAQALKGCKGIGKPGKLLVPFAGAISEPDLAAISEAVSAGCEQVNRSEW
jgi:hypothetical protein